MTSYDLLVIGAGSGGLAAAKRAARHGAKVAIFESDRVGGTCVIYGCVPKKMMVYASQFSHVPAHAAGYGWQFNGTFDWPTFTANRHAQIDRLNTLHIEFLEKAGVTLVPHSASFIDPRTIEAGGHTYSAPKILIAVGGKATRPNIPGAEHAITSKELFGLSTQPKTVVIVGGGYIGTEFAGILNGLGTTVHMILRGDQVLRGFDSELAHQVQQEMQNAGINIHSNCTVKEINSTTITLSHGDAIQADQLLFATGRAPNLDHLNIIASGVAAPHGKIQVHDRYETNVPHIFALGDCTDTPNLTPVAIAEGRAFADTQFGDMAVTVNYDNIPTAVFSQPELATVGLSEAEAKQIHGDSHITVHRSNFRALYHLLSDDPTRTTMKLIVHNETNKVLGAHMVGEHAAEIIQSVAIALNCGATKADFDATMALHPSSAEEFVTIG
ncbi:MAG: glutathione-disulfide reductase [bacterium]|nr:glutathione-disulfide reductase [bacterium]